MNKLFMKSCFVTSLLCLNAAYAHTPSNTQTLDDVSKKLTHVYHDNNVEQHKPHFIRKNTKPVQAQQPAHHPHHPHHAHHKHHNNTAQDPWVKYNGFIPRDAVIAGYERNKPLFVCQARHAGGMHPGKVVDKQCNISYGGKEYSKPQFAILVDPAHKLHWRSSRSGHVPSHAFAGGHEDGHSLYVCRAHYRHAEHAGKVVGNDCHFGWGGKEIRKSHYEVLVR